jgi:hypothetical protein
VQNYLQDAWPVTVNLYTMAVEDFSNGRPEFESRVHTGRCKGPMKKWNPLTNAGHSVLGLLEPFMAPTINACMEDETFRNLLLWIQSYVISYEKALTWLITKTFCYDSVLPTQISKIALVVWFRKLRQINHSIATIHENLETVEVLNLATLVNCCLVLL